MFRGEALTTDNRTACRFDTAEAEWKSDLLFARCKSHRLRKGKAKCAPNHDGARFPLAHDHPYCPGNVPTAEVLDHFPAWATLRRYVRAGPRRVPCAARGRRCTARGKGATRCGAAASAARFELA